MLSVNLSSGCSVAATVSSAEWFSRDDDDGHGRASVARNGVRGVLAGCRVTSCKIFSLITWEVEDRGGAVEARSIRWDFSGFIVHKKCFASAQYSDEFGLKHNNRWSDME